MSAEERLESARSIGEQDDDLSVYVKVGDLSAVLGELRRLREALEELERDKEASAEALVAQYEISTKAEAEVERLEELVLEAESDIKAMGMEAHPAVLMRLDRLVRRIRAAKGE